MAETKIYLYLKTHRKTGLRYLGKTKQDPYKYLGSGKRWRNHLSKHGADVETQILLETTDEKEIAVAGKFYSALWNVVESNDFANLKIEAGEGGFDHINNNPTLRAKVTELSRKWNKENNNGGTRHWTAESYRKVIEGGRNTFLGRHHSDEAKRKISQANKVNQKGENNSHYGKVWCRLISDLTQRKSFAKENIPDGWITSKEYLETQKDKRNNAYGKHWYNNGRDSFLLLPTDNKITELNLSKGRLINK